MNKLLLCVDEAADALGLGRTKLYALLKDGRLKSVRLGKNRRIPRHALEAFVESLGADPS